MARRTKATRQIEKDIAHGYDLYQDRLFKDLVRKTPIDTGQAQRGWKQIQKMGNLIGTNKKAIVLRNDVPYIQRLDEGWSSQAPKGYVEKIINTTRKP